MRERLDRLLQELQFRRYLVPYLTIASIVLILIIVLFVRPDIERGGGWIGLKVQRGLESGALTAMEVVPNSPAYDVGIIQGDLLLSFKGIALSDVYTLRQLIRDAYIGEQVRIILARNGARLVADTRIAKRPDHLRSAPSPPAIVQGTLSPHPERGTCLQCHTILPRTRI